MEPKLIIISLLIQFEPPRRGQPIYKLKDKVAGLKVSSIQRFNCIRRAGSSKFWLPSTDNLHSIVSTNVIKVSVQTENDHDTSMPQDHCSVYNYMYKYA